MTVREKGHFEGATHRLIDAFKRQGERAPWRITAGQIRALPETRAR